MSAKDISLDKNFMKSDVKNNDKNDKKTGEENKPKTVEKKELKNGQKSGQNKDQEIGQKKDKKNENKVDEKVGKEKGIKEISAQPGNSNTTSSSSSSLDDSISASFSPRPTQQLPTQSIQTAPSSAESDHSMVTLESLKYLQILDQYVSGMHWEFDMEYILNCISGVVWSLLITFFIFYDIDDKCWDRLRMLMSLSVFLSGLTAVELTLLSTVWYLSLIKQITFRSRICTIVIVMHIMLSFFNLLIAVINFGSWTCFQWGDLHPQREHLIVVRYDVKMIALLHCIVSINLMLCAMLLAIKRNDFKFYVLWRKGLLNQYILLDAEDE